MTTSETPPIACTLTAEDLRERLAGIAALARDALRDYQRDDLVLDVQYAPEAAARLREMVRKEQACCAFLAFDLREEPQGVRLRIRAPEEAREVADMLFAQFIASAGTARLASPR